MRIAFYTNSFPELSEGFVLNQITGLMDRGHQVDIYAHRPGNAGDSFPEVHRYGLLDRIHYAPVCPQSWLKRTTAALGLIARHGFRDPHAVASCLRIDRLGLRAASLRLLYAAVPFLGKSRYDVIHCQFGPFGTTACLLRLCGVLEGRIVTSFRGYDMAWLNTPGAYDLLFAEGDQFLPVSKSQKKRLIQAGCPEERTVVLRSGIDIDKFRFAPRSPGPGDRVRILSVARLVEKKGLEYGIRAFARLRDRFPHLEYRIIGTGPERGRLEALIEDLGISDSVKLLGPLPRAEVCRWLHRSHVLLAPSLTARSGDREGIPNALKEAMATGLPVVSTSHSGIPELVREGESGFLVRERNLDALVEKLAHLVDHPELWPGMGRAGRRVVEQHYDHRQLNDTLVRIYEELVAPESRCGEGAAERFLLA